VFDMSPNPTAIPHEIYELDPIHSTIGFSVDYNGVSRFRSRFDRAEVRLADGVLTGSADVESLPIQLPPFRKSILSLDFFGAERHPQVTFTSDKLLPSADGQIEVEGELTIRGVTRPVKASGTFAAVTDAFGMERVAFSLVSIIDRRDFGMTWQNPLPAGGDNVGWNVTVEADLQLVQAPPAPPE
jgi:polyisoprenoid-binding protein YceI